MNISSDKTFNKNKIYDFLTTVTGLTISIWILGMSYGYYTQIAEVIYIGLGLQIILNNLEYSSMTKAQLKEQHEDSLVDRLSKSPILAPIGLMLLFALLGTMITGNLFMWKFYLAYIVITGVMYNSYLKKHGIEA